MLRDAGLDLKRNQRESPGKVLHGSSPLAMIFSGPKGLSTGGASWLDFHLWVFSFLLTKIDSSH